jgi:hypothetical protein
LAAGVLVIAGTEHGRANEQIAPLVELGHHRVDFGFGTAQSVEHLPIQAGLAGVGLVEAREGLGGDAVAVVLLHHPALDANRAVVITAAVAAGFPGHWRILEAAHLGRCSTTPHFFRARTIGAAVRFRADSRRKPRPC